MLDIEAVGQRDYALIERFLDLIDSVWKPYHRFELRGLNASPKVQLSMSGTTMVGSSQSIRFSLRMKSFATVASRMSPTDSPTIWS